jgi:hypothetical protein
MEHVLKIVLHFYLQVKAGRSWRGANANANANANDEGFFRSL